MRGAVGRPPPHGVGHQLRRYPGAKLDLERLQAGVARLPDRQLWQVSGALRASRRKPLPTAEAIPRRQPNNSDSMREGGTHMLREARLVQLIQCVISYDKSPKLIIRCHTACKQDLALRPSLARQEGQRRKYQYYRRRVGIRPRLTSLAGPDHAT